MASRKLLLGAGAMAVCASLAACSDRDTKVISPASPPVSTTTPPANTAAPTIPTDPSIAASNTSQMAGADFEQVRQQLSAISAKVSELEQKHGAGGAAAGASNPNTSTVASASGPTVSGTPPTSAQGATSGSTGMTTGSASGSVGGGSAGGTLASDEITRLKLELDVLRQRLSEVEQRQRSIGTAASK